MKPRLPGNVFEALRQSGRQPPWKCKLRLRQGRTVYGVEISDQGEIVRVQGRAVYSSDDIGFSAASIVDADPV